MHKPIALLIGIFASIALRADGQPSAREILGQVRLQQSQQQLDLQGQLRSDATVIPFRITQTGPVIRYTFANPPEVVQLRLGEDGSRLDLVSLNSTKKFSDSRLDEKIGGTAVTYGDLALKFLYWPNAQVIGADTLRTRNCWKLRLTAPSKDAQYATVLLWVDKESGALMRVEGYNQKNQLVKRFEVVSAQKIEGRWFLKQMRIEEIEPATNKVRSRSYLEIKNRLSLRAPPHSAIERVEQYRKERINPRCFPFAGRFSLSFLSSLSFSAAYRCAPRRLFPDKSPT